jgi:hypothetical protein
MRKVFVEPETVAGLATEVLAPAEVAAVGCAAFKGRDAGAPWLAVGG